MFSAENSDFLLWFTLSLKSVNRKVEEVYLKVSFEKNLTFDKDFLFGKVTENKRKCEEPQNLNIAFVPIFKQIFTIVVYKLLCDLFCVELIRN